MAPSLSLTCRRATRGSHGSRCGTPAAEQAHGCDAQETQRGVTPRRPGTPTVLGHGLPQAVTQLRTEHGEPGQ